MLLLYFGGERWQCLSKCRGPLDFFQQPTKSTDLTKTHRLCMVLEVAARDFGGGGVAHDETSSGNASGLGRWC